MCGVCLPFAGLLCAISLILDFATVDFPRCFNAIFYIIGRSRVGMFEHEMF